MNRAFEDKVVWITGASSGIGEALSLVLAAQGASLGMMARRAESLQALAKKIEGEGGRALVLVGDVNADSDLNSALTQILDQYSKIDVLIANAGFGVIGRVDQLSLEDYRRQFETNVFGVLRTIQVGLEALKRSKGTLVLIGSVSSYISAPEASAYSMSKFAVRALAEALRAELARDGVSVVLITPGFVKSQIRQVDNQGEYRSSAKDPIPEWMQMSAENAAKKIAKAVLKKKRERVITFHGKVFVLLQRFFPGLSAWFFKRAGKKFRSRNPSLNA